MSSAAGALAAAVMTPLATAPTAHADEFALLDFLDPAVWLSSVDGVGGAAWANPGDWSSLFAQLGDSSAVGDSVVTSGAAVNPFTGLMQDVNGWLETNWISTPFGEAVDSHINAMASGSVSCLVARGLAHPSRECRVRAARRDDVAFGGTGAFVPHPIP